MKTKTSPETSAPFRYEIKTWLSPELYDAFVAKADEDGVSMIELVNRFVAQGLKRPELGGVPRHRVGRPRKFTKAGEAAATN